MVLPRTDLRPEFNLPNCQQCQVLENTLASIRNVRSRTKYTRDIKLAYTMQDTVLIDLLH